MLKVSFFTKVTDSKVPPARTDGILEFTSLKEFVKALLSTHIVFGTFKDNYRCYKNLIGQRFLWYDYDDGSIKWQEVSSRLGSIPHIVLASKSHLIDKDDGKGPIERFHIIIILDKEYKESDKSLWKFVWRKLEQGKSDKQCCDMTRYFFKHRELLGVFGNFKKLLSLDDYKDEYIKWQEEQNRLWDEALKRLQTTQITRNNKRIEGYLSTAPPAISGNNGNLQTYKVAVMLHMLGGTLDDLMVYNQEKCLPQWENEDLIGIFERASHSRNVRDLKGKI